MSLDIISFLESNFEKIIPVPSTEGEYKVSPCPSCGSSKNKLYVNVISKVFHCFRCDYGRGDRIEKLFHDMGAEVRDYIIDDGIDEPKEYKRIAQPKSVEEKKLPDEFRFIIGNNSLKGTMAMEYLRRRGVKDSLISDYKMGFCYDGAYNNRVIVPYYEDDKLVYFVARDFTDQQEPKYLNPEWEKTDFLFNYDRVKRSSNLDFIVVMEGPLDVLSMPDNAVCLLGKYASKRQKEILARYKTIYIALDSDALVDGYKLCASLAENIKGTIKILELPEGKDPFDLKEEMWSLLKTAKVYKPTGDLNFLSALLNSNYKRA